MTDYEKLGLLYLGRLRDAENGTTTGAPYLYDSRDLVTHAAIVGMTGSGKTGLGIVLIEEAAIDGIPVIAIDPKGDLSNLMLTFPHLAPADLRPWIDETEATRRGISPDAMAAEEATRWREGLRKWDQAPERAEKIAHAVDRTIYTPGSAAGRRLALLRSFEPPANAAASSPDAYREKLAGTTSGLLALAGIEDASLEDPARMLVSAILDHAWSAGKSLSLEDVVHAVSKPPIDRVGVMDVEAFFPARARFGLAMKLNALLAGTGPGSWAEGEPLDVHRLLWSESGRPRLSVMSIAHLGDAERMFFVTTLLSEIVSWMRTQSGTSSLRALLYLDEAMGFLPPVASPPSKGPMLTLLKQARAFGLGVVVATQNPVDLDYKALSNAGTWFLGRLQTERDRLRVLDALESAARPGFDRKDVERMVAGLASRQFLAHDARAERPITFESRWALSYLRGPLTTAQITMVAGSQSTRVGESPSPVGATATAAAGVAAAMTTGLATGAGAGATTTRPALPPDVRQVFVPVRSAPPPGSGIATLFPALLGIADLAYESPKHGVDLVWTLRAITPLASGPIAADWARAGTFDLPTELLSDVAPQSAAYGPLCREASVAKSYAAWQRAFERWAIQTQVLRLFHCAPLKLVSRPGESRAELAARVSERARELRDRGVDELQRKHAPKIVAATEQLRLAEIGVRQVEQQVEQERVSAGFGIGSSIVGALLGRKVLSAANVDRAGRAVRGAQRMSGGATKIEKARQSIERSREKLRLLQAAVEAEVVSLDARVRAMPDQIEEILIKPKKASLHTTLFALAWVPFWPSPAAGWTPA